MIWIITIIMLSEYFDKPVGYTGVTEVKQITYVNKYAADSCIDSLSRLNNVIVKADSCDIWRENCLEIKRDALMNAVSTLLE